MGQKKGSVKSIPNDCEVCNICQLIGKVLLFFGNEGNGDL